MIPDRPDLDPINIDLRRTIDRNERPRSIPEEPMIYDPFRGQPHAPQATAQAEAMRIAEEVARTNGISVAAALAAMEGLAASEERFGIGPTPAEKEVERQPGMNRADRRREQHERKVERRAAARRVQR